MANYQSILSFFAVALFLCLNGSFCQNEESQERLYASLSVLLRVTKDLGKFYPERINLDVSRVHKMNNFLDTLKSLAALLKDQHALEEETSKAVLATVADNACTWVKFVMEDGSFNCTEVEVDSLVNQVILKQSSRASWTLFRRPWVCPSCQENVTAEIEWVNNRIPCTGSGAITRAYLADNFAPTYPPINQPSASLKNFEEIRCSSTTTTTTTIPVTTMALA